MKYLYTYSMNEKEPLTVTSLSIKESHASLNDNSDRETIGPISNKRKHKFTQQYSNGPVLERDEDVYMDDIDKNDENNMEMLLNDLTDSFRHLHIDNSSIDTEMTEADDVEVLEIIDTEMTEAIDVETSEIIDTEIPSPGSIQKTSVISVSIISEVSTSIASDISVSRISGTLASFAVK
ncbi:hypothetical protein BDF21DRAFT_465965 [Thamnidium elegans]|nr:hypothetical protein BDF21DRAFT_465965 [Thamnidium elegans]